MCTLSWLPLPPGGFTLCFNRDERTGRSPGRSPSLGARGDVRWLAPVDGDFGGTWIGANDRGLVICLANRYPRPRPPAPPDRISRGLLAAGLLDAADEPELRRRLRAERLERYEPFTLGCVVPGETPLLLGWDGAGRLAEERPSTPGMIHASPAERTEEIVDWRRRSFAREALAAPLTPEALARVHASHWPERGPRSVCFHHELASTVSRTHVVVGPDTVTMTYTPGPPCVTPAEPPVTIPRRR